MGQGAAAPRLYSKGPPDSLLPLCGFLAGSDAAAAPLTDEVRVCAAAAPLTDEVCVCAAAAPLADEVCVCAAAAPSPTRCVCVKSCTSASRTDEVPPVRDARCGTREASRTGGTWMRNPRRCTSASRTDERPRVGHPRDKSWVFPSPAASTSIAPWVRINSCCPVSDTHGTRRPG